MSLFVETEMKQVVVHKKKKYTLNGFADYTLGYSNERVLSGNLIVVEAKRRYHMGEAYGQLLSYMGLHCYLNIKSTRLTHSCRHGPSSKKVGEKRQFDYIRGGNRRV
jgi:hypothetical protein